MSNNRLNLNLNFVTLWSSGAAAASRLYVDAVGKLGRQAQQGTWGGCADIGKQVIRKIANEIRIWLYLF